MKRNKLTLLLVVDVMVASIALAFVLVAKWNTPLGPSLASATDLPSREESVSPTAVTSPVTETVALELTPTPSTLLSHISTLLSPKSIANKPLCGGPSVMYILLIGSDERSAGYYYGLADSIRLARVDFTAPKVTMLDFPRDLWVEIPGISDHYGVTNGKLNQAYFFGNRGMGYYDGPGEGPGLTALTLQENFGARVDHYLAMDMGTFVRMVDAIDGIDIHIDSTIDLNPDQDGAKPDLVYGPGNYHLDGTEALRLARNRIPSIFERARYQTMVLKALENKLLTAAMIPVWPQIIADFTQSVQTDLSPSDISKLVCIAQKLTSDNISTAAFPDKMFASAHTYDAYRQVYTYTLDADFNRIRTYVADFMNGIWP